MKNNFFFLRHGEPLIDSQVPVYEWILTEFGQKQCNNLVERDAFNKIDIIYTSKEKKAYLTARPFVVKLKKSIIKKYELNELKLGNYNFKAKDKFIEYRHKCFLDLDYSEERGETCREALNRFQNIIDKIDLKYQEKSILIVSHGTVLTLYFANLMKILENGELVFNYWKHLKFCSWGLVKNKKIIKNLFHF